MIPPSNQMKVHRTILGGGLDTSTSPMSAPEGCVIGSVNYQERVGGGGYERVGGYERFDGQPRPSDALVTVLKADSEWGATAAVGVTVTGAVSGATGVVCYWSTTLLGVTKAVGSFGASEQVLVGATPAGSTAGSASVGALVMNDIYAGAEDIYRADIDEVPGSGPVRGVCVVGGNVYAFRDNVGATQQDVWKATTSGWTAVTIHRKVRFTNGNWPGGVEGGSFTLTQGGVTGICYKVMVESGDETAGTAAGTMILGSASGGEFAAGAATAAGGISFDLDGAPTQITLDPGGKWQFKPYRFSFTAPAVDEVIYGVDRTDDGGGGNFIEFDGSTLAPLTAGGIDGPYRLETHKNHLFVVYRRTSVQFSSIGDPYRWSVLSGAGEILAGERVTELLSVPGSEDQAAMLILCSNRSFVLYGNSSSDFKLVPLSRQVGAKQYSAQVIGNPIALDEHGIRNFVPTSSYGNFAHETLTNHIQRHITDRTPVASAVDRKGGHYRLYLNDGEWWTATPAKRWSWMQCRYPVTTFFVQDWEIDGESVIFMTCEDNGYVYMLDRGRTFDGEAIEAWFKTTYAHFGAPVMRKAFRGVHVEIIGQSAGSIKVQADYSYGSSEITAKAAAYVDNSPVPPPATPWDLGEWDNGSWDSQYASLLRVHSEGVGENVSLTFYSNADTEKQHHITAALHFFLPRRMARSA